MPSSLTVTDGTPTGKCLIIKQRKKKPVQMRVLGPAAPHLRGPRGSGLSWSLGLGDCGHQTAHTHLCPLLCLPSLHAMVLLLFRSFFLSFAALLSALGLLLHRNSSGHFSPCPAEPLPLLPQDRKCAAP